MLFFNFLCLFYLMVLINSHTISKNIANDETIDDIVDSIHDLEYRREYEPRHDRLHRYYRREEKECAAKPKKKEEQKNLTKAETKPVPGATKVTITPTSARPLTISRRHFWQKLRYRGKENKSKSHKNESAIHKRKVIPRRRIYKKQHLQPLSDWDDKYDDNEKYGQRIQRNRRTNGYKRKRDVSKTATTENKHTKALNVNPFNSKNATPFKLTTARTYEPLHSTKNINKALTRLTTDIENLKKEYGFKLKTGSFPTMTTQSVMKSTPITTPSFTATTQTVRDMDFLGTAEIEALLNQIKVKEVEMVSEQSPALTDMITNTVTETTFEADPILNHISTLGYALSTFISIDKDGTFNKRTIQPKTDDTVVIANTEPTHHISARSVGEDVYTIAQTIEHMLQKELNTVYHKLKGQVNKHKATTMKAIDKITKKTHCDRKMSHKAVTTPMTTPKTKPESVPKNHKSPTFKQMRRSPRRSHDKSKTKASTPSTVSTFDDYVMLTLMEQILAKTHEDNVMKMLSIQSTPLSDHHHFRLFKRTPVTLARVSLKRDADNILTDDILDYGATANDETTESEQEVISLESLSNKISYNDYVNGYKHYLKFQKEQGNQKFSNLVRYQAHRHHSVDDIGKFILNKIPQLATKRRKRFFDDDTMDDQDISTKSDDSWFKKHFYFSIDNGPPKKFHNSQTVKVKSPVTSAGSSVTKSAVKTPHPKENVGTSGDDSDAGKDANEDDLEELSKALDERKNKAFSRVTSGQGSNLSKGGKMKEPSIEYGIENIFKGLGSMGLIDKFFKGKGRRHSTHNVKTYMENNKDLSETDREKRNTKANVDEYNNLYTTERNTLRSTVPNIIETRNKNYGYVDVNLIPRPTAILKLRENKQKKSKFKNFLKKIGFRRKKQKETKKSQRNKRGYRVQRFNPFKKLKNILTAKSHNEPPKAYGKLDYEIIKTRIDTFKPVKFDKPMSIDEIKGQIPNITEDQYHHGEALKPAEKTWSVDVLDLSPEYSQELPNISPVDDVTTPNYSEMASPQNVQLKSSRILENTMKQLKVTSPSSDMPVLTPVVTTTDFETNIMPEMTSDPSTSKSERDDEVTPSVDDVIHEIDDIQVTMPIFEIKPMSTTPFATLSMTGFSSRSSSKKDRGPPQVKEILIQPKKNHKNAKANPKDIKIQTKLTRIVKFPLTHHFSHDHDAKLHSTIDIPKIFEYGNENKSSSEKILIHVSPKKRIRKKSINMSYITPRPNYSLSHNLDKRKSDLTYRKPYPDYFNDLLLWHGDLLNSDRLTTQWESIFKDLRDQDLRSDQGNIEVTTASMIDMLNELRQMKEYLKIEKPPSKINKKPKPVNEIIARHQKKIKKDKTQSNQMSPDIIKTVAVKNNAVAEGKDIIVQGVAKYFQLLKQPESDPDKYSKAADVLNDLNQIHFKSPAIKYNVEDKINDKKRDREFWADNTESKDTNSDGEDSSSILFLDTTLLAYDDGPYYLTDRPKYKKMSQNYKMRSSKPHQSQVAHRPVTKTNPSPLQYFSTPLPMGPKEFDRFLKDNQLDVLSVTTPLQMPKNVLNKTPRTVIDKQNNLPKSVNNQDFTNKASPVTFNFHKNSNKMTIKSNRQRDANKNNNNKDKRRKRYKEVHNNRFFTFKPFRIKPKPAKVKKMIKLFDKRPNKHNIDPITPIDTDIQYTVITPQTENDNMENEVELTIINMDDIVHGGNGEQNRFDEKLKTEKPSTTRTVKCDTKTSKGKLHGTLTYPSIHKSLTSKEKNKNCKKSTKPSTTKEITFNYDENKNLNVPSVTESFFTITVSNDENNKINFPKITTTTTEPSFKVLVADDAVPNTTVHLMVDPELLKHFQKHKPKRVKISSHSYKYDVLYNDAKPETKNARRYHKYGFKKYKIPSLYNNNDKLNSPSNSEKLEIIKIVRAVETVENYTRPNVIIHIDLPTYYIPYTGPTEKTVPTKPKSVWNDFVMKHLSGLALIELLNKFGLLKSFDVNFDVTDGVDNAVNASKVFSTAEYDRVKEMKRGTKSRKSRHVGDGLRASTNSIDSSKLETMAPNWREKRRLKLFSNIKTKLKTLLRNKTHSTKTSPNITTANKTDNVTTATMLTTIIIEERKAKREKHFEINGDGVSTVDEDDKYDFDINQIMAKEKATANSVSTNLETTEKDKKQEKEDLKFKDTDIVLLSQNIAEQLRTGGSTVKDDITPTNQDSFREVTLVTTTANSPLISVASPTNTKEVITKESHDNEEDTYFDPQSYDNKIYYESTSQSSKSSVQQTLKPENDQNLQTSETKVEKRDCPPPRKHTAKDVAALEVIVDLVKNTESYDDDLRRDTLQENYCVHNPSINKTPPIPNPSQPTNAIQVHIAVPYNLEVDKKRSLDSFKLRRVFAAKMSSPVDLEYQVQSFEDNQPATPTTDRSKFLAPKMYLLIDANGSLVKGSFPKAVGRNLDLSELRPRQVDTTKAFATQKSETTSAKSIGRVTLSKDFVAAVNKHLVQLYENLSVLNESALKHHVRARDTNIKDHSKGGFRRHINWDAVKQYFGHDRRCNCKCKANRTMCRACAASDAVISELIFEFDNLAKYMNEHCTEIQTFFWMNPSGGKKLRDAVKHVDKTLNDYYRRVKGKCQGRTCKTFATCIDKRSFIKQKRFPKKYIGAPLIVDLERTANDIDNVSKLGICHPEMLIGKGETLINTIGNCTKDIFKLEKSSQSRERNNIFNNKRSAKTTTASSTLATKQQTSKNCYSLDNIKVNIICKPGTTAATPTPTIKMFAQTPQTFFLTTGLNFISNPESYDSDITDIHYKKRKGFRNFFANKKNGKYKMNNFFTYYMKDEDLTTPVRYFEKRQIAKQIEAPLVSDAGGLFWKDYLKGSSLLPEHSTKTEKEPVTNEPNTQSAQSDASTSSTSTITNNEMSPLIKTLAQDSKVNERILSTTTNLYPDKHIIQRNANSTDYSLDTLSYNINELFKIFHNLTDLKAIENMSTPIFELNKKHTTEQVHTTKPTHTTKPNHTKASNSTKIYNIIKNNMKHKSNATKSSTFFGIIETEPTFEIDEDAIREIADDASTSMTTTPENVSNPSTETTTISTTTKTTTITKPATIKSATLKEKSTQTSQVQDSSQSESTTQNATTITEAVDANIIVTEKPTKSNIFNKIKMATLEIFHRTKKMRKTTAIDTNAEIRKSRSPVTESTNSKSNNYEKPSLDELEYGVNVDSEPTSVENSILIINEYDTETGPESATIAIENDTIVGFKMESGKNVTANVRSLLISILNYEAKKLNREWRRIKKGRNRIEINTPENWISDEIGRMYSTDSTHNQIEDIESEFLRTLKELGQTTPLDVATEKKRRGVLQKFAKKLGIKLPGNSEEKPKVKSTKQPASPLFGRKLIQTPGKQMIESPPHHKKHQDESSRNPLMLTTNAKFNPQHTTLPKTTVNATGYQEAPKQSPGQVCDIDATLNHVQQLLQKLPRHEVENYITNKTCDKYKDLPKYFLLDVTHRKRKKKTNEHKKQSSSEKAIRWDWIRNKRSLVYTGNDIRDTVNTKAPKDSDIVNEIYLPHIDIRREEPKKAFFKTRLNKSSIPNLRDLVPDDNDNIDIQKRTNFAIESGDAFEALEKDAYGIYRRSLRRNKRAYDIKELEAGLKNLPYSSKPNESYVMLGDTVILQCAIKDKNAKEDTGAFKWTTDRKDMLSHDNVVVDGANLIISDVGVKNLGDYTCQKGDKAQKKLKLTVITLPTFNVIFNPVYLIHGICTYNDLKIVKQFLGPMMSKQISADDQIVTVKVEEPVCLRDRMKNTTYLRLSAVLTLPPRPVRCSARCRRDLHNAVALWTAEAAPELASVGVIIMKNNSNKTLEPSFSSDSRRTIITHTLRRKDSNKHRYYYSHEYSSGGVNVRSSCPAGYYLIPEQKICAASPVDNSANPSGACAANSSAQDGAGRFRRCFWWYPSCTWCAAGWGAACACAGAAALLNARGARAGRGGDIRPAVQSARHSARTKRARPLSPSRVILAKFFRGSRSSTKATDSQEAKFGLWKEKNLPPPLPPIDFDL